MNKTCKNRIISNHLYRVITWRIVGSLSLVSHSWLIFKRA